LKSKPKVETDPTVAAASLIPGLPADDATTSNSAKKVRELLIKMNEKEEPVKEDK